MFCALLLSRAAGVTNPLKCRMISLLPLLILYRGVAQLVEHRSPKPGVAGSSPVSPARNYLPICIRQKVRSLGRGDRTTELLYHPSSAHAIMISMQEPTLEDIEALMTKLAFPFYKIERISVPPLEPRRYENDVEHSWSVAFLACSLAPEIDKGLDVGKIAQFAIVHDLIEVFAGDTTPWQPKHVRHSKEEREAQALQQIERHFSRFPWIIRTIKEYESRESHEAKFVWAVDKILPLLMRYLERGQYYVDNGITKQHFDEGLVVHRKKAHAHPKIGEYYDKLLEIFEKHPEYFAQTKIKG